MCAPMNLRMSGGQESVGSHGAGVTGNCVLLDMDSLDH